MGAFETGPPLVRPRRGSPVLEGHVKAHERSMHMKGSSCYDMLRWRVLRGDFRF